MAEVNFNGIPIAGFEDNRYLLSKDGEVYSTGFGNVLRPMREPNGRTFVHLYWYRYILKCYIDVLLASHFIPNPMGAKFVMHKDGDWGNNDLENLEWYYGKFDAPYYPDAKELNPKFAVGK